MHDARNLAHWYLRISVYSNWTYFVNWRGKNDFNSVLHILHFSYVFAPFTLCLLIEILGRPFFARFIVFTNDGPLQSPSSFVQTISDRSVNHRQLTTTVWHCLFNKTIYTLDNWHLYNAIWTIIQIATATNVTRAETFMTSTDSSYFFFAQNSDSANLWPRETSYFAVSAKFRTSEIKWYHSI